MNRGIDSAMEVPSGPALRSVGAINGRVNNEYRRANTEGISELICFDYEGRLPSTGTTTATVTDNGLVLPFF